MLYLWSGSRWWSGCWSTGPRRGTRTGAATLRCTAPRWAETRVNFRAATNLREVSGFFAAVAMRLVEAGAELEAANHELDRPLHLAASVGNLEVYI